MPKVDWLWLIVGLVLGIFVYPMVSAKLKSGKAKPAGGTR